MSSGTRKNVSRESGQVIEHAQDVKGGDVKRCRESTSHEPVEKARTY